MSAISARPLTPSSALAWLGSAVLVSAILWFRWSVTTSWNFVDLLDFSVGGRTMLAGGDIYAQHPGVLPFNYPPFGAAVFVPLAAMGLSGAKVAITVVSLAGFAVSVAISAKVAGMAWPSAVLTGGVGLALEPVARTFVLGQVGLLLMTLVMVDVFVLPARYKGVLIGLAAGIKLTPAFFVVFYLLRRNWAAAVRSGVTFATSVGLAWWVAPESSRDYWLGGFDKVERFGPIALSPANQSLRAVSSWLLGDATPPSGLVLSVCAAALVAAAVGAAQLLRVGCQLEAVCCLAAGTLLGSPISWTHHWVWVVPALVALVARRSLTKSLIVGIVFLVSPMWLYADWTPDQLHANLAALLLSACYALLGLAFILAGIAASRGDRREA